jgi:hypothetical protein
LQLGEGRLNFLLKESLDVALLMESDDLLQAQFPVLTISVTAAVWHVRRIIQFVGAQTLKEAETEYKHDDTERQC